MPTTRELRIAPVMTGGSSLAVWMGGVTSELYSMLHSAGAHSGVGEIYGRLLRLSETLPVVDVITGTSAGGLNGSLLAMAIGTKVDPQDFDQVRKTWMNTADLDQLIRKPNEPDPPSLLRGDEYFLEKIDEVLDGWTSDRDWERDEVGNVDLVTTYTCVNPVIARRRDDFGSRFDEYVYAGTLHFTAKDFQRKDIVSKIAIASRTSASIPGVFEPSFLPSTEPDAKAAKRPNFGPHQLANARGHSRWAVDGGLVVNLPLTEALRRVFDQSATSSVRRVFLYVRPTPEPLRTGPNDEHDAMPTIVDSLRTVTAAPRAEGVANDIDTIHNHNEVVRRKQLIRRNLPALIGPLEAFFRSDDDDFAPPLFDLFRECRSQRSIDLTLRRIFDVQGPESSLDESEVRRALNAHRQDILPRALGRFDSAGQSWAWGIAPIEEAGSTVLGLVNQAFDLNQRRRRRSIGEDAEADARDTRLSAAKQAVHCALDRTEEIRTIDEQYWRDRADQWQANTNPYEAWPYVSDGAGDRAGVLTKLKHAHEDIAEALINVAPTIRTVAREAGRIDPGGNGEDIVIVAHTEARSDVAIMVHVDHDDGGGGSGRDAGTRGDGGRDNRAAHLMQELDTLWKPGFTKEQQQHRLLLHHVASTVLLDDPTPREQPSEIMQISWNAENELDSRRPADKLAGPEFKRFGAFVKPSWRANDWMWGRMDGAAQLARLLVEPERWYDLGHSSTKVKHDLGLPDDPLIDAELRFLDHDRDPEREAPQLAKTTQWLRAELQHRIALEELQRVADAVRLSADMGSSPPNWEAFPKAVDAAFAPHPDGTRRDPGVATIKDLMQRSRIGAETTGSELGSDTTVRLGTRAVAVAGNALTGANAGLGVAATPLKPLRPVIRSASSVASLLSHPSRFARALTALVLAVAGALLAVGVVTDAVPPLLTATSLVLLVAAVAIALLRSHSISLALVLVAISIPIGLAIAGDRLEDVLYSTAPASDPIALPATGEITVDGDAVVTVSQPNGADTLDQDLALPAGTTLSITSGTATVTSTEQTGVADWKRYGFIGNGPDWWPDILPVLTVANIALLLGGLALIWWAWRRRKHPPERTVLHQPTAWRRILIAGIVALALIAVTSRLGSMLLTGPIPTDQASEDGGKGFVMWSARRLGDWELPVLVIVLAFIGAAIGTGLDKLLTGNRRRSDGA